ncbi:MAG: RimK family alpha-L-glutamate ligase [Saprospiraceae bacterium]
MIIGVLSRNPGLYSTQSLVIAGRKMNHRMLVLDPYQCSQLIDKGKHLLYYQAKPLLVLDAIIPRIGATATDIGASLIDHFVASKVYTTTTSDALLKARNKWACAQFLAHHDIAVPSACLHFNPEFNDLILKKFSYPLVIKILKSTQGMGVMKAETKMQALSILEAFQRLDEQVIIQEFIDEANRSDIRVLVVNGRVAGSMRRRARKGDFRSNLHQGGVAKPVKLSAEEESLALKATFLLKLDVAGVDILRSSRGPLVLEVNASPGLEGIEQTTKVSISEKIIQMIEEKVHDDIK